MMRCGSPVLVRLGGTTAPTCGPGGHGPAVDPEWGKVWACTGDVDRLQLQRNPSPDVTHGTAIGLPISWGGAGGVNGVAYVGIYSIHGASGYCRLPFDYSKS